jgi:hypothetical protein
VAVESFRCSFWLVFFVMVVLGLVLGLLMILAMSGFRLDPVGLVVGLTAGELVGLLITALLVFYFKVYAGPEGLRAYNFWGLYRTVAWEDIRSARPVNFLGLRYLRAHTANASSPLWLPLFLTEQDRFDALVRAHAGPSHPLTRALLEGA